jgi:hypothetical protein
MDANTLAEDLYKAVCEVVHDAGTFGLLAAAGDAKDRIPFDQASSKTRVIFLKLAENLTRVQAKH